MKMTMMTMMITMGTNLLFELGEDVRIAHVLHRKSGQSIIAVFVLQLRFAHLLVIV
jgi:hypothetical protein